MQRNHLVLALLLIVFSCYRTDKKYSDFQPPVAEKKPVNLTIHGEMRVDDYFWLNQREDSSVIRYLKAENDYLDSMMAHARDLEDKLYNELKGRIKEKDNSVP